MRKKSKITRVLCKIFKLVTTGAVMKT